MPSTCRMMMFPLVSAMLLIGGLVVLVLFLSGDLSGDDPDSAENLIKATEGQKGLPEKCPKIAPGDRMLLFWQTEIDGATEVPEGVTHVVFGFSEVTDNVASLKLQGNENTLKIIINELHSKCVQSFISIGGANNLPGMAAIDNPNMFADSLVALADNYDVDGIEIDDENVGSQFNVKVVVDYMTAAQRALKNDGKKVYDFTWDGLVLSLPGNCGVGEHSRCYPKDLTPLVDWVNVLAYNVFDEAAAAATFYEAAIEKTFQGWLKLLNDKAEKLSLATCVPDDGNGGGSCTYGVGASKAVVTEWTTFAKSHGGMFLYAGSADKRNDYQLTNTIINAQK